MGVLILYASLIIALNLAGDMLLAVLDPRVRLS
jgi:ABC-type dipeptide/oligopeptide/nickel transport system permease component